MPHTSLEGFVTRPEASKVYRRSQRALERELDAALATGNEDVLEHYKLATKDKRVRDSREVTTRLVKDLQADGMAPVWYVRESYLEEKYGRKDAPPPHPKTKKIFQQGTSPQQDSPDSTELPGSGGVQPSESTASTNDALLQRRILELEQDKADLREEIRNENEQIREANERSRETNVLMKNLHELMGDMQQRLLPMPAGDRATKRDEPPASEAVRTVDIEPTRETPPSAPKQSVPQKAKSTTTSKKSARSKRSPAKKQKPSAKKSATTKSSPKIQTSSKTRESESSIPTFRKIASKFFSR